MEDKYTEEQKYIRAKNRVKSIKGFYVHLSVYLIVNLFLFLSSVVAEGDWNGFWEWQSYSTAFFWGIGLAFHAFKVFGLFGILGQNWEDRKIKEIMDKDKSDSWQ